MREPNLEELRASRTLQDDQVSKTSYNGLMPLPVLRHAQLGSWWERALAVVGIAILVLSIIINLWRIL